MVTTPWDCDNVEGDTVDVTDIAVTAGWTLPESWLVVAWLSREFRFPGERYPYDDEPEAERWYAEDRFGYVSLWVKVIDTKAGDQGVRVWTELSHSDESARTFPLALGEVPVRDAATGEITARYIDPIADRDDVLLDVINKAVAETQQGLIDHAARNPVITGPTDATA